MKNLFEHTSAKWVRYSDYEYKEKDGTLYLVPTEDAMPSVYDPMKEPEALVLKMTEIGQMCFKRGTPDEEIQAAIREFACQYGLLGLMTALPTTAKFIDYEKVYLPKNEFIRAESMDTFEYMEYFFPFKKPDFRKTETGYTWSEAENMMSALMLTFQRYPESTVLSFMRYYGERYDWLKAVFKDWCFQFVTSYLYYHDLDKYGEDAVSKKAFAIGLAAFPSNAPTYHIELREHPVIVWDFHSLKLAIQMLFTLMVTDDTTPLRMCRHCQKAFFAKRKDNKFCSTECRKRLSKGKNYPL